MSTNPFLPFIRSQSDEDLFLAHYADAPFARICLENDTRLNALKARTKLWIDAGFDGIANAYGQNPDAGWKSYVEQFGDLSCLAEDTFLAKPEKAKIEPIVRQFLRSAASYSPHFITVPQLPLEVGTKQNKINRVLAEITADWRRSHGSSRLVLPIILTSTRPTPHKKTSRNPIINQAAKILTKFGIDAVWSVDSTLSRINWAQATSEQKKRFPAIREFFEEPDCSGDGGNNNRWTVLGTRLEFLWARGLVTHFGIGLGSSYRYFSPGGRAMPPKAHFTVGSLRRWAVSSDGAQRLVSQLTSEATTKLPRAARNRKQLAPYILAYVQANIARKADQTPSLS